jgi:hypothetical protein
MKSLEEFIADVELDNKVLGRPLTAALMNKDREGEKMKTKDWGKPPPEPKVSLRTIFSTSLDIMEIDEEEIARQLTLVEFETYAAIKVF